MEKPVIIITSPSIDSRKNVGGISTVTSFLIQNNLKYNYIHFELGKLDEEKRGVLWFLRILKAWCKWGFLMIKQKDVLIHFNFALDKRSIIRDSPLIFFSHLLNKKMAIHLHGGEYLEKENTPKWIMALLRTMLSWKNPKIVLSPYEKELIIKKFHAESVNVLPNSIDIKEATAFKRSFPYNRPIQLLFIGRIVERKGINDILQALIVLKDKGLQFKYVLAGTGPDKQEYVNRCSSLLGSDFEFKGIVSGELKTNLLKTSNVFLLPSLYGEGLPIALLESMSFQLVPIVTDDGSMKYVIQDSVNGIIVEKGSSENIAEAIESLILNEDLLQKLGQNAALYVFSNHNPEDYINELNKIYENS